MAAKEHKEHMGEGVVGNVKSVSAFTRQAKCQPVGCAVEASSFVFFAFSRGCFNCGV
jgi:hypothetical protein